jgi:hypothetical protein
VGPWVGTGETRRELSKLRNLKCILFVVDLWWKFFFMKRSLLLKRDEWTCGGSLERFGFGYEDFLFFIF